MGKHKENQEPMTTPEKPGRSRWRKGLTDLFYDALVLAPIFGLVFIALWIYFWINPYIPHCDNSDVVEQMEFALGEKLRPGGLFPKRVPIDEDPTELAHHDPETGPEYRVCRVTLQAGSGVKSYDFTVKRVSEGYRRIPVRVFLLPRPGH